MHHTTIQITLKIISEGFKQRINSTGLKIYCYIESVTSPHTYTRKLLIYIIISNLYYIIYNYHLINIASPYI